MNRTSPEKILDIYRARRSSLAATSAATPRAANSSAMNSTVPSTNVPRSTANATVAPTRGWVGLSFSAKAMVLGGLLLVVTVLILSTLLLREQAMQSTLQERAARSSRQVQTLLARAAQTATQWEADRRELRTVSSELHSLQDAWQRRLPEMALEPVISNLTGQRYRLTGWPRPEVIELGPDRLLRLEPQTH